MEVIFVLFAVVVIAAIVYGYYAAAQRRKELMAWAQGRGLRFSPAKDRTLDGRFSEFDCLSRGHSRYARNLISGDWSGREFLGFDYH